MLFFLQQQIRPLPKQSLDVEQGNMGKNLPSSVCHEPLISPKETHRLHAIDNSCVSAVQPFILPDTNDSSFSEAHPMLKCNKTIIQRPNIVIPETVPMDCTEEDSLKPDGVYSRDCQISQHTSDIQEAEMGNQPFESEETLKSSSDVNTVVPMPTKSVMSEPGSPVFDRFREVKSLQKKSLESPTLFDEEDDCGLRDAIKSNASCLDTPVRGSIVIQKSKTKRVHASFKEKICLDDTNINNFLDTDSMKCSSPSVISGGMKRKEKPVGSGEANSDIYFPQNHERNDLVPHVKAVASSDLNASVLQQKQGISDNHLMPGVYQGKLSSFSLRQSDKTCAKENRMSSDIELQKSTPFFKNRLKRKRPSDPDETFCPLGSSILESSACESTHYVAPGESVLENSVGESTHFIAPMGDTVLENCSPVICNLDSLATVYVPCKNSPDVQLTFSELEREITICAAGTDLNKSGCSKTLLGGEVYCKEVFKIPSRKRGDSSLDSPKLHCTVKLAENCDRVMMVCDASSSVQMKLDDPVPMFESPAESQASQCLLGKSLFPL